MAEPQRHLIDEYNGQPSKEYILSGEGGGLSIKLVSRRLNEGCSPKLKHAGTLLEKEYNMRFLWAFYLKPLFLDVFLPQGYPNTVAKDYVSYQLWDTLQAFASSLNGSLATTAVLKGIGVGNESATVLAASITWILKDGTGMLSRIAFAWAKGSNLDSDCKRWRLLADGLNDLAFFNDLLGPYLDPAFFFPMTCLSSLLRSLVSVAGGATRMAIVRHQARRDNLADVAAKDGSQETMVNVLSLVVSLVLLPQTDGRPQLVWALFITFAAVHLYANYRAVKSLQFDTLNQMRFTLAVRHYIKYNETAPSIICCNQMESVLLPPSFQGKWNFGCQLRDILMEKGIATTTRANEHSILAYNPQGNVGWIALSASATEEDCFNATFELEYCSQLQRWPSKASVVRFRDEMLLMGWKLSTHQMGFDEWRYREIE